MSNFFDKWLECNDTTKLALLELTKGYCAGAGAKAVQNLAQDSGFSNLRKWLAGQAAITAANYYKLVLCGLQQGWLGRDDDAIYRGFSEFLGVQQDQPKLPTLSYYEINRYSFLAQGYILRGALEITKERGIVGTKEFYVIQKEVAQSNGLGDAPLTFSRTGFLFKRGPTSYLMISKRDKSPNEIQTAYLETIATTLRGPFSDWQGKDFYAGRIHMTHLTGKMLPANIRAVKPGEVSPAIEKYLTQELAHGTFVAILN